MGSFALNFLDIIGEVSDFWFLYPTNIQTWRTLKCTFPSYLFDFRAYFTYFTKDFLH